MLTDGQQLSFERLTLSMNSGERMYAVIFTAEIRELDEDYQAMAARMRELAQSKYGCVGFTALTQGNTEVALSYWETLDQIRSWKQDPEHLIAQDLGRKKWYSSYHVQVVQVIREYSTSQPDTWRTPRTTAE